MSSLTQAGVILRSRSQGLHNVTCHLWLPCILQAYSSKEAHRDVTFTPAKRSPKSIAKRQGFAGQCASPARVESRNAVVVRK